MATAHTLETWTLGGVPYSLDIPSFRTKQELEMFMQNIFSNLKSGLMFTLEGEAADSVSFYAPIDDGFTGIEDEEHDLDGSVTQYEFKIYSHYPKQEQRYTIAIRQVSLYADKSNQSFVYEQTENKDWKNTIIFDYLWRQREDLKQLQVNY